MIDPRGVIPRGYGERPSDAAVREQLERILQSRTFSNAPSLSRFLRRLVQQALEGTTDGLKEYSIGVEVFDRGESFDPRIDNIVRVQARRLRAKLGIYYASEGHADPVVIEAPKGQYAAGFRQASHPDPLSKPAVVIEFRPAMAGDPVRAEGVRQFHLPAPRTPLIGRDQELELVKGMLLAGNVRLLTLTGAGGSGKTRLALEAASQLVHEFPGGVWFIPLSSISDPALVAPAIAQALAVRHTAGKPVSLALCEHVRSAMRAPALLVVDNLEHVLDSAALLGELLDASGAVTILVTSRAALRLYGEHEFSVPPLATPDLSRLPPPSELRRNPAVELFVQRAAAVNPAFELNRDNAPAIAEICILLDGLPLAIELAAARMRMLPPAAMLARFDHRLELLTGGARDVPARQQTLRKTIDWSHGLLNQAEQKLFRRLALFAGGCTLESAEAVCDARRDLGLDILQGISSLMAQSLVLQRDQNGNGPRFVMLETLREYALERLIDSGESEATRQAHAAYALVVAEERNAAQTPEEIAEWLDLCGAEHDNFRTALAWLIETDCGEWALRLGIALFHFWEAREHLGEGREWLQAILNLKSAMGRTTLRARAASCTATLMAAERDYDGAFRLYREALDVYRELGDAKGVAAMLADVGTNRRLFGDLEAGRRWLDQALIAYRALGDRPGIAGALSNLAGVVSAQGDHAAARALFEEALSIFSELGDSAGVAWSYNHLGDVAFQQGDLAEARRLYAQGADIFHALTDRWGMAGSYTDLGYLACELREFERACSFFEQALRLHQDLGHMRGVARVFDGLACVAVGRENAARALTLAGAAEGLRRALGAPMRTDQKARLERSLAPAWQNCGAAEAGAIWAAALAMPLDDAIRFAFQVTVKASTGT